MADVRWFFLLVFAFSVPFWVAGELVGNLDLPIALPIGALQAIVPAIAAAVLVHRELGWRGGRALLTRAGDVRKVPAIWYVPIVLLWPALMTVAFALMALAGEPVPREVRFDFPTLTVLSLVFLVSGTGEQLGWQAYAVDRLQTRTSALRASLIVGAVWATWHVVPFMQIPQAPWWIFWQCAAMIPFRTLIVWIYNGTGRSVFATVAFQASANVSQFSFPNNGSAYDPFYACVLLTLAAVVVAIANPYLRRRSGQSASTAEARWSRL